jgi:hypothetical protein
VVLRTLGYATATFVIHVASFSSRIRLVGIRARHSLTPVLALVAVLVSIVGLQHSASCSLVLILWLQFDLSVGNCGDQE